MKFILCGADDQTETLGASPKIATDTRMNGPILCWLNVNKTTFAPLRNQEGTEPDEANHSAVVPKATSGPSYTQHVWC